MLKIRFAFIPVLLLIVFCTPLLAALTADPQAAPWEIVADEITYDHAGNVAVLVAKGSVVIRQLAPGEPDGLVIKADWVRYDLKLHMMQARGNLTITAGTDKIRAESAALNLDSQTGTFRRATMFRAENNLYLAGDVIEKTGRQTYRLRDSWLTTCPITSVTDTGPWSIKSRDTRITTGGYARLKHAFFRIKKIPVLYLPYLIMPANLERKSGLLFPEYSQSERDGTGLLAPLFINISPSSDITLYPGYLTRRGPLVGLEARYIADPRSRGTVSASYLHDSLIDTPADDYKDDGFLRTEDDRYWVRGKFDQDFGDGVFGRMDLDLISDRDYLQEYKEGLIGFRKENETFLADYHRGFQAETIPWRENTIQLSRRRPSSILAGEMLAIDDRRPEDPTPTSLWSLPRLLYAGIAPLAKIPADLSWESEYIYYWRERGQGAHRLDLHPQLVAALPTGPYLEATVTGGLRETLYLAETHGAAACPAEGCGDTDAARTLYDIEANVATSLVREFTLPALSDDYPSSTLRHTVRPEIGYAYVPDVDQSDLPDMDMQDRVEPKNWFTYGLNNYFFWSGFRDKTPVNRDLGYLKITQAYNRRQEFHPLSDLAFDLNLSPIKRLHLRYETTLSMYGQGITHYYLRGQYSDKRGDNFQLNYRYLKHGDLNKPFFYSESKVNSIHSLTAALKTMLTEKLSAKYNLTHSFSTNSAVSSSLHLLYRPGCWSVELVTTRTPDDFSAVVVFSLEGIGKALELGVPGLRGN